MQNLKNKDEAVVVFSGGQDSTTCLLWALKKYKKVYAVSFDYGQRQSPPQLGRAGRHAFRDLGGCVGP